ncbi:disease resistance RPP13-like protein 4 isoform X1 [Panicum miliaceum]|uniref:Disease resistance RPP13-like protein 4 isoform X1 n=1 Tax=Panicum miliaceum TaxID=4540 RepID=A0A3L6Q2K9_PANMI|nr:disease resistance RPP13-like protein 4 isoform X1 [Panicum miliaceum]
MAEIVVGAMGSLLPKLANLIKEEYNLQKKVRGEIMFLETELKSMEAALIKVSEAPIDQPPDIQVKLWTREVRELSYDLEDRIDKFMVRIDIGMQPSKHHSFKGFIDRSLSLLTKGKIRHNIGIDIKDIRSRIKDVSERRDRYKVDQVPSKPVGRTIDNLRLSALYKKATELVGTEEKSNDLIKRLVLVEGDEASKQQVVVSIVGFGGLGKTTLANLVYEKLKGQFHCGAFVSVSHNPNMDMIFKNMLHQLDGENYKYINQETWSEEQLISKLRKFLEHKRYGFIGAGHAMTRPYNSVSRGGSNPRYLIVVDDIWNNSAWETIQCALIQNECGSRIITTTRNLDVAKQSGADVYQLDPLSSTDSTKLFNQRIFGSEDKCPPDNLVEVCRKILRKCGGVPLAIITIASMLSNKNEKENTQNYWSRVYQSMGSGLDGSTNVKDMRRILSVSYYDLPSRLKSCLLYLSLFPEDYEIEIEDLIWKWIGEGFVHEEQGRTLYEVGEAYIEELVNRSMIQAGIVGGNGRTITCRVHDMVLDLTNFLSNEEHFLTKLDGQKQISLPNKIRRLSLKINQEEEVKQLGTMDFSHVRSLTVSSKDFLLIPNFSTFPVLRVLDLRNCPAVKDHDFKEICNMFHLRYLGIDGFSITEIPKEIQNLQVLQVLHIKYMQIEKMPSTIIHLQQLQLLRVSDYIRLPDGFGKLKSLQEVKGTTIIIESPSMLHDLGSLTELRTLAIYFRDWDESYEKPFIQCLSNLVNLKSMRIEGQMSSLYSECDNLYPGPQELCSIDMDVDHGINAVPRWMSSFCFLSSVNIELLTLGEQDLQVLGSIPSLSDLRIIVKELTQDRDARLVIGKCYSFQCLTRLIISYGSMEVVFAPGAMQHLKELYLRFSVQDTVHKFGDANFGLENLSSLERVTFKIKVDGSTTPKEVETVKDEIQKAMDMNPRKPTSTSTIEHDTVEGRIRLGLYVNKAALIFSDGFGGPNTNRRSQRTQPVPPSRFMGAAPLLLRD